MGSAPYWPGMMKRATAAAYCEISAAEFEREVSAGRMPLPVKLGNSDHWSRAAIDEMIARLGGTDWRRKSPLYGTAA